MRQPATFPRTQNEVVVRVIAGDLVGDDAAVLEGLEALRADLADIRQRIATGEEVAHSLPHRERYLLLAHGLTRRVLAAYEDWLDDVERELKSGPPRCQDRAGDRRARRRTRPRASKPARSGSSRTSSSASPPPHPGYSLASSLGLVVAAVGLQSPAIMLLAFVPMLLIAASYYYMNRADADAGRPSVG